MGRAFDEDLYLVEPDYDERDYDYMLDEPDEDYGDMDEEYEFFEDDSEPTEEPDFV